MAALLKTLINMAIQKLLPGLGGIKGWLLAKVLQHGGQALLTLLTDAWNKITRSAEQKKAEAVKNEIVEDPKSTIDEKGKAYEDYLNSGRN